MSLENLTRITDVDHEETVESVVTRAYFNPEFAKPGDEVTIIIETSNVADNTDLHVVIYAEDDDTVILNELDGQVSSNRCELQYSPLDGATDDETLKENLGITFFRIYRCKVEIESLEVEYERSANALQFGKTGAIIMSIDECFAPRSEEQLIRYKFIDFTNEVQGAKLKVFATSYDDNNYPDDGALVYELDIPAEERRHNREFTIKWLGQTSTEAGPLAQSADPVIFINPQFSPFTVEMKLSVNNENPDDDGDALTSYKHLLEDETEADWTFKVEYHSVRMEMGDFVPPGSVPDRSADREKWIQYRVNTLGYPSGPVDGIIGPISTRAIKNFQRANWRVPWPEDPHEPRTPLVVDGIAGDNTFAVLESSQMERREWFSLDDFFNSERNVKLYHWASVFYQYETEVEDGEQEWDTSSRDEFGDSRHTKEAKVLNRPWIPILGKIMIKNKAGEGAFVPQAVGQVRVNFNFVDPAEDLDVTSTDANYVTREYIDHGRREKDIATGDNCPTDYAGARNTDEDECYKVYLDVGSRMEPYISRDDSSKKVVYVLTPTGCDEDGTVGVFFKPSFQAGDDYRIRAELDFEDHANRENIEPGGEPLRTETARLTNWRKMKVAAFLKFSTRQAGAAGDPSLEERITAGLQSYGKAFIEYEGPNFTGPITEFLTEDEYKNWVYQEYNLTTAAQKATVRFRPTSSMYPFDLREQNNGESARDYKSDYVYTEVDDFFNRMIESLGRIIVNNVRKRYREGNVLVDAQFHEPVDVYSDKGGPSETLVDAGWRTSISAIGLCNGLVYLDIVLNEKDNMDFAYLLAHEIGHNNFLYHWENTWHRNNNLVNAADYEDPVNFRIEPTHHDHDDDDCIMSYPITFNQWPRPPAGLVLNGVAIGSKRDYINYIRNHTAADGTRHRRFHQLAVNCRPHFCAKCLLNMRGWNVTTMPRSY
jgi:Putative peptidoglycan binding domain